MENGLLTETIQPGIKNQCAQSALTTILRKNKVKCLDLYFQRRECCAIVYMLQCIMLLLKWVLQKSIKGVNYQSKLAQNVIYASFACLRSSLST